MQVAAPPKGSISVGWLWVSFLNMRQPVLRLPVHRGGDVDGTGVDLLRLVQVLEQAPLFQHLGSDGGQVHQGLGPGRGLLRSVHLRSGGEVAAVGGVHRGVRISTRSMWVEKVVWRQWSDQ